MDQADILYRAFLEYRKYTLSDVSSARFREVVRGATPEKDRINTVSSRCIIEEDWVNRIYEGLPYIGKAIDEERQFIRQQGEVVPIEKAKRVSKGSVEHLARHSEYMTHEPEEGGNIIPDKLFIVERLSDYAVYENRFLYMLLCYLRDFIDMRYSKIIELGNTYKAEFSTDKEIIIGKRNISYTVNFREEAKEDPYGLTGDLESNELLARIEEERHLVAAYLMTPLMKKVSEAPLLKPPVTRTNALKMNVNFKAALELYDYLVEYTADGYRIEYDKRSISPFSDRIGDEFAEFTALTSFLVYEYGKDMQHFLKASYEREEERLRQEAEAEQLKRLEELRQRVKESGKGAEEYMLLLEERNRTLQADSHRLSEATERIAELEGRIHEIRQKRNELLTAIDALKTDNSEKDTKIHELTVGHEEEIARLASEHSVKLDEYKRECDSKAAEAVGEHERKRAEAETQLSALREEDTLLRAELRANKQMNGSITEEGDFTSRERFEELEREYEALGKLLTKQWKKTKRQIRRRVLWNKDGESE